MKLLKIVPNDFRNASRDLRELAVARSVGYDVTVICKQGDDTDYSQHPFPVIPATTRPWAPLVKSPAVNRVVSVFAWARLARRHKADVISCHDIDCLLIGWLSTLFMRHKPRLVYDSHEYEYGRNAARSRFMRGLVRREERFLIRRSAATVVVGDAIADLLVQLHRLDTRPVVVRNIPSRWVLNTDLISRHRNELLARHHLPENTRIVMYHGAVTTGRGIETAIAAMPGIPDAVLVVVGNGSEAYLQQLRCIARDHGVEHRVLFLPAVPPDSLPEWVPVADVSLCLIQNICPSYYYSLPNKLFETIQARVPVVGSNFPEINAVIATYGVGTVCNPADADAVADAVRQTLATRHLAIDSAAQILCWENESQRLATLYRTLMSS